MLPAPRNALSMLAHCAMPHASIEIRLFLIVVLVLKSKRLNSPNMLTWWGVWWAAYVWLGGRWSLVYSTTVPSPQLMV